MRDVIRIAVITSLVAASAKASIAGYDLLMASIDSQFRNTYSSEYFRDTDSLSASMRDSLDEINGNYDEFRRLSGAKDGSADIYKP